MFMSNGYFRNHCATQDSLFLADIQNHCPNTDVTLSRLNEQTRQVKREKKGKVDLLTFTTF